MENPERTVFRRPIVPQNQIAFIGIAFFPSNRCNRIVWDTVRLTEDKCIRIRVCPPACKDMVGSFRHHFHIIALQTDD